MVFKWRVNSLFDLGLRGDGGIAVTRLSWPNGNLNREWAFCAHRDCCFARRQITSRGGCRDGVVESQVSLVQSAVLG